MADPIKPASGPVQKAAGGAPPSLGATPPVESGVPPRQSSTLPAGGGATALAVAHGGLPGGKPRADGHKPGSKEAIEADREKARLAKAAQRARLKAATVPPPLPALASRPVDTFQAPGPDAGVTDRPEDAALVPWTNEDLSGPLLDSLELLEEADKLAIEGKLQKANLPVELQKELMAAAAWPERPKKGISKYGAAALAKGLNALGLSAKHKDVALILPSVAYLITDRVKLHKRLDELIKAANPQPGQSPAKP